MRLIDADKLKETMMKYYGCEDATKYGNETAEQQARSYSTLMLYEVSDMIEDCIDNAPTVELDESVIQEVLNKKCMTVVANEHLIALHGKRPQGEWVFHPYMPHKPYCDKCECNSPYGKLWDFCPNCGADMRKGEDK